MMTEQHISTATSVRQHRMFNYYPVVVYFRREFVDGPLKGLTQDDHVGFTDKVMAAAWVDVVNDSTSQLGYRILSYKVVSELESRVD